MPPRHDRAMTRRPVAPVALILGVVVLLAAGCADCPAALLEGTLAPDERGGLGVHQAEVDVIYPVEWPSGTSVREVDGELQLLDGFGQLIAVEGDRFSAGGGFTPGPNEVFQPCGGIEITRVGG
jgi:hypothetical protein